MSKGISCWCTYIALFSSFVGLCVRAVQGSDCSQLHSAADAVSSSEAGVVGHAFVILCMVSAIFFLMAIVASVFFLRGIFKRLPKMLAFYNWFLAMKMLDDVITGIWAFSMLPECWSYILCLVVDIGVMGYMLVCAEALYHKMKEASQLVNEEGAPDILDGPLLFGTVSLRQDQQDASPPPPYDNLGAYSAANSLATFENNMTKGSFRPASISAGMKGSA